MTALIPSPSFPTVPDILRNFDACFESIRDLFASPSSVVHGVLMFDEIATEKRARWDSRSNHFLGICREHGSLTCLKFENEGDLKTVVEDVEQGEVHLASEVSISKIVTDRARELSSLYVFKIYMTGYCRRYRSSER